MSSPLPSPEEQQHRQRPAQRRGVTRLEARARSGELVNLRRRMGVRAVAAHAIEPEVIGEDEDDVGLVGGGQAESGDDKEEKK